MTEAPVAGVDAALQHTARLMQSRPDLAERQARQILEALPNEPRARMFLGAALRRQGDASGAAEVLEPLAREQPRSSQTHMEFGLAQAALGNVEESLAALRHAVGINKDLPDAWRAIADQLFIKGDTEAADAAYAQYLRAGVQDPALRSAAEALADDRLAVAEHLLRDRLRSHPSDVAAMRMLAETGTRLGRYADAEALLETCLELAPSFDGARYNLAIVLYRQQKGGPAIPHLERLLAADPNETAYRNLLAACLGLVGEYQQAAALYDRLVAEHPRQPKLWLSYGHTLRTLGRRDDAVSAYSRCIELAPNMGEAFWSLANLKTVPFSAEDEEAMRGLLARPDLSDEDRLHVEFALGKAMEDLGEFAVSFEHYAAGARLRAAELRYDADQTTQRMQAARSLFTAPFFADRTGSGAPSPAPIFIVGLPRSGSTLLEQILASHSAVEGTMELPDIAAIARELTPPGRKDQGVAYPEVLASLEAESLAALGEDYLSRTAIQRKLGRPHFIDKMPNNFNHIGLIQLILPNARIIDARRHPMAACFSSFKQHFARGQQFSYDLTDVGRYYADYVTIMDHFDEVLPGRIHRVIYEDLVEDMETQVHRLLDYCGLPFESACLQFHENERAVRTASSEQVRRPIYREGLEHWRNFDPWLGPLKDALGPTLECWRGRQFTQ